MKLRNFSECIELQHQISRDGRQNDNDKNIDRERNTELFEQNFEQADIDSDADKPNKKKPWHSISMGILALECEIVGTGIRNDRASYEPTKITQCRAESKTVMRY